MSTSNYQQARDKMTFRDEEENLAEEGDSDCSDEDEESSDLSEEFK
jgi:hypothetical protein